MAQLNDDVLHVIFDHLDDMLVKRDPAARCSTAWAVCLTSRRLLSFGCRLLYSRVTTVGPRAASARGELYPSPGAVVHAISQRAELGALVEKWQHIEGLGRKTEHDVLSIEKLDQACPRLRDLMISVVEWSEGGGENDSSHLRRQVRALSKPSCALAGRLRSLSLSIIDSSGIPTIKLGKLLSAAVQLQVLGLCGVALGGFPRSAIGPPSLTALHVQHGDLYSFLPLIEATPTLKRLYLGLSEDLDPLIRGVKALSSPHLGVVELHLKSTVQAPRSMDDPTEVYQNVNAFVACFPNLSHLNLQLSGDRRESTGIDLDKVPRGLTDAVFGFDGASGMSWNREDTAGPTAAEVEAWIKRGGAPRLQKLNIGRRATLEGVEGLQKVCDERGVVLEYELA